MSKKIRTATSIWAMTALIPGMGTTHAQLRIGCPESVQATMTEAKLIVEFKDDNGNPRPNEIVLFKSKKTGRVFKGVSGADGQFCTQIPLNDDYEFQYKVMSEWVDGGSVVSIPDFKGQYTFTQIIVLNYQPASNYLLKNVFFDTGKATLRPESEPELKELLETMSIRRKLRIRLEGHTDNVGDDASNLRLSQARAEAVKAWLVAKGIDAARIEAKGFGETQPVADNFSDEGRQLNRRTEARILGGYFEY
jgi:outer membrane protein OmpA-like peptidoglycan-associated protein